MPLPRLHKGRGCFPNLLHRNHLSLLTSAPTKRGRKDLHSPPAISAACWAGMGKRREARERAVQFLFQYDLNPAEKLDDALDHFWNSQRTGAIAEDKAHATWGEKIELPAPTVEEAAVRLFADPLIRGTLEHRTESDECIKKHAQNWDLHRIAAVDPNILRLSMYEML